MFPFAKQFIVIGEPRFDDPLINYPLFGKDLENLAARLGIQFGETGLFSPSEFPDNDPPHFEYRIFKGNTTSSEYEPINFDYLPSDGILRVSSCYPETKVRPIVDFIAENYLGVRLQEEARATNDIIVQCRCMKPSPKRFEMIVTMLSEEITDCLTKADYDIQNKWWMKAGLKILAERPKAPDKTQKGPLKIGFDHPTSVRIAMAARTLRESLLAWIAECHPEQFDSDKRDYNTLAGQTLDLFEDLSTEDDWIDALFTLNEDPHGVKYNLYNPTPFTCLYNVCMKQGSAIGGNAQAKSSIIHGIAHRDGHPDGKTPRATKPRTRAKDGELTQEDVAKDFHVARKTVLGWENGKNNPWGYYKKLRTDPSLRSAYQMLVYQVGIYYKTKKTAKDKGKRFRITFAQFQETLLSHNKKVT